MLNNSMIFDGGYLIHRTLAIPFYANMMSKDKHVGLTFGILKTIAKMRDKGYSKFYVAWDKGGGSATHRDKLLKSYKSNRKKSTEYRKTVAVARAFAENILQLYGVEQYYHPEIEADDVIAYLIHHKIEEGIDIYTSDKDLYQLVTDDGRVRVYRPDTDEIVNVRSEYGVAPDKIVELLAITGDKVDNIVGINSVGKKIASKYINGGLDVLTDRQRMMIQNNQEVIRRNKKLIVLKDDIEPIKIEGEKDLEKFKEELYKCGWKSLESLTEKSRRSKNFMDFV